MRLEEVRYTVNTTGNFVFLAHRFGAAPTQVSIDALFDSASASATVPMTLCTPDGVGGLVCAENGSATVSASWTGHGELARSSPHNDVAVSDCDAEQAVERYYATVSQQQITDMLSTRDTVDHDPDRPVTRSRSTEVAPTTSVGSSTTHSSAGSTSPIAASPTMSHGRRPYGTKTRKQALTSRKNLSPMLQARGSPCVQSRRSEHKNPISGGPWGNLLQHKTAGRSPGGAAPEAT